MVEYSHMRLVGLIALIVVLFASLFGLANANLTNNVTAVALMVLLISLFSDLKEFNFWGLKGKAKEEQKLKDLKGESGVSKKKSVKLPERKVQDVIRQDTVVLMDNDRGDFLALAFDIERLLRVIAAILEGQDDQTSITPAMAVQTLREHGVLTDSGEEQVEAIRWLKDMLVEGRENELASDTISNGNELAQELYKDLREWLDATVPSK